MIGSIVTVRILGRRHVGVVTLTNGRDLVHVARDGVAMLSLAGARRMHEALGKLLKEYDRG